MFNRILSVILPTATAPTLPDAQKVAEYDKAKLADKRALEEAKLKLISSQNLIDKSLTKAWDSFGKFQQCINEAKHNDRFWKRSTVSSCFNMYYPQPLSQIKDEIGVADYMAAENHKLANQLEPTLTLDEKYAVATAQAANCHKAQSIIRQVHQLSKDNGESFISDRFDPASKWWKMYRDISFACISSEVASQNNQELILKREEEAYKKKYR